MWPPVFGHKPGKIFFFFCFNGTRKSKNRLKGPSCDSESGKDEDFSKVLKPSSVKPWLGMFSAFVLGHIIGTHAFLNPLRAVRRDFENGYRRANAVRLFGNFQGNAR
jgi:hypothetical protein